jgi:hypothetical protein
MLAARSIISTETIGGKFKRFPRLKNAEYSSNVPKSPTHAKAAR